MAKCPKCNKELIYSMSENRWKCPAGCDSKSVKLGERAQQNVVKNNAANDNSEIVKRLRESANKQKVANSTVMDRNKTGNTIQTIAVIYGLLGIIAYIILAVICFIGENKMQGFVYLGTILDVVFVSAAGYVAGSAHNKATSNSNVIRLNARHEATDTERLNKCIDKINMQSKCILELTKEIESLKKEINK